MKLSLIGRWSMALFASLALVLGATSCTVGTIGYMWVLGQEYNQVAGFKVDQYSGNLTEVPGSPFASNGSVPVSIVIKQGGRYVYVINQGVGGGPNGAGADQSIALYSVGGDGTLAFQIKYNTVGYVSEWAQMDSSGTYLYVLDKYSPGLNPETGLYNAPNTDGNGSITAFVADPNTGRLTPAVLGGWTFTRHVQVAGRLPVHRQRRIYSVGCSDRYAVFDWSRRPAGVYDHGQHCDPAVDHRRQDEHHLHQWVGILHVPHGCCQQRPVRLFVDGCLQPDGAQWRLHKPGNRLPEYVGSGLHHDRQHGQVSVCREQFDHQHPADDAV
jgi:hypothetical protein